MYNLVRASVVIDVCSTHFSKMWMHECTGTSQGCGCTNVQALLRGVMHECTGTSQGCGCTNVQALLKGTNVQALLRGVDARMYRHFSRARMYRHFSGVWMHECTGTSQGCGCTNIQALLRGVDAQMYRHFSGVWVHECTGTSQGHECTGTSQGHECTGWCYCHHGPWSLVCRPEVRERMKNEFLNDVNYNFEAVNHASKACGPLVQWAIAQVRNTCTHISYMCHSYPMQHT